MSLSPVACEFGVEKPSPNSKIVCKGGRGRSVEKSKNGALSRCFETLPELQVSQLCPCSRRVEGPLGLKATYYHPEQTDRPMVVTRKVWDGNRTERCAHTQIELVRVLQTFHRNSDPRPHSGSSCSIYPRIKPQRLIPTTPRSTNTSELAMRPIR
jgi:hypothetical protein